MASGKWANVRLLTETAASQVHNYAGGSLKKSNLPPIPHDLATEMALVGCCLTDGSEVIAEVQAAFATPADLFHDLRCREMWHRFLLLVADGRQIHVRELQRIRHTEDVEPTYFEDLAAAAIVPVLLPSYLQTAVEFATRRKAIETVSNIAARARDLSKPFADSLQSAEKAFASIQRMADKDIPFVDASEAIAAPEPEPPVLVTGLLHKGSKLVLGGGSKSFKTWSLIDLAISVATGSQWWGMDTVQGRVLYLNFEVQGCFFTQRVQKIARAKGLTIPKDALHVANLRGQATNASSLLPRIAARAKDYSLVVLDPLYKLLAGRDENAAGDMSGLMNELERLAVQTGAAVAFGAHFSKGNQAGKESIDRISGSGVFARDPDAILLMTRHEEQDAFAIETTLRNFAPMEPFCVKWNFPLMRRDGGLNPEKLKQAGGRKKKYTGRDILEVLKGNKFTTKEWFEAAHSKTLITSSPFYNILRDLKNQPELKQTSDEKWFYEEIGKL